MGPCLARCLFAPILDRLDANDRTNRQRQERVEQAINNITGRLPINSANNRQPYSTSVTDIDEGQRDKVSNDVSYQILVDLFDSLVKKPLEQLNDKIDNLSKLITTYVTESKLASREREFEEILNILTSNSVSAERFAWLESQVELMAACCLPPECKKKLMNEWQLVRAIHQRRAELETSLGPNSATSAAAFPSPFSTVLRSFDTHTTSAAPPPISLRTKSRGPTASVKQANVEQPANNAYNSLWVSKYKNVEAEAVNNYDTIVFLTRELAQRIGKIIITMLQHAKYENVVDKKRRLSYK